MYTHCVCKVFFYTCKIDMHATVPFNAQGNGFMHRKDINSSSLIAILLPICDSLWQLSGQYFTAVCVSSVKKEKDYMQVC